MFGNKTLAVSNVFLKSNLKIGAKRVHGAASCGVVTRVEHCRHRAEPANSETQ